jgi:hypothetical protein
MNSDIVSFSYEKKVRLRDRIERLVKNKKDIISVIELLTQYNPMIHITKNKNGSLVDISELEDITYVELDKLMDDILCGNKKNDNKKCDLIDDNMEHETTDAITQKRLKYTNSENHILNRVKYEKALKIHQQTVDNKFVADKEDIKSLAKVETKKERVFKKK